MSKLLSAALLLMALCASAIAGNLVIEGRTDKEKALYAPGEKMIFSVMLLDDGKPVPGETKFKWTRAGDDGKSTSGEGVGSPEKPLAIETSLATPGFVRIQAAALDAKGETLKNADGKPVQFEGGAGVEIEELQSLPEPEDFDAFWARQKEKLASTPLKASVEEVHLPEQKYNDPNYQVYAVKVDCPGGKQVVGWLRKPKDAAPRSCPAIVVFDYYAVHSVDGPWSGYMSGLPTGPYISFNFNVHGIENRREKAYYEALRNGELKNYAFDKETNSKPETAYFNGMALRLMRALEFVKSLPEWNGRDLIAYGGSQGGFQALLAAGLDKDVSYCEANCPWSCDLGGINRGRLRGWRPDWTEALGYYDPANHAKRIKCETSIKAGLGDYTCPPSGIACVYNNIKASKTLTYTQCQTHAYPASYMPSKPQKFSISAKPAPKTLSMFGTQGSIDKETGLCYDWLCGYRMELRRLLRKTVQTGELKSFCEQEIALDNFPLAEPKTDPIAGDRT